MKPVSSALLLAAVLPLAACSVDWNSFAPIWFSHDNTVSVEEVRRSQQCNSPSGEARVALFPDVAAVRAWEASRSIQLIGDEPLDEAPYALVEMGTRNTGGYGIAVSRAATRDGDDLVLKATFVSPGADREVAQVISSPCALVRLPQAYYKQIEVRDQDGNRRARGA
jgi:hypothetical protein